MSKIKAKWKDKKLIFDHFIVKRESASFVGVYDRCGTRCGRLITSAETLQQAAKKTKLLEMGYQMGFESAKDIYCEGWQDWP